MAYRETVQVRRKDTVVTVCLSRPEVRNAFNAEMIEDLTKVFAELRDQTDVRVVILSGEGPAFSAGADVNWMRASLEYTHQENLADAKRMSEMFTAIDEAPFPVIGRVHGACLGGGMGLTAVCDVVVAAEDTVFGFTEARLGIIPAVISTFVLPKIGRSWARALYLTAERFGPEVARQIGLVHWIVPIDALDELVWQKVDELLASGPLAVGEAKALIRMLGEMSSLQMQEHTAERIAALRTSSEGQEGLQAFLDRRPAPWRS